MGYQPGLDGLRAISVIAVIIYHAGFSWMSGGFLGVEVFFVVSGFLITMLLIEEHESSGAVNFRSFWVRRARRLFPALAVVLVAVSTWVALFGSAEQASQMRRDLPWSVLYAANWGQIVGDVPYFAVGDPPILRHLWSLAVEEQWYVVWPLVCVALLGWSVSHLMRFRLLIGGVLVSWLLMWWVHRSSPSPMDGVFGLFSGSDRTNFVYLSTLTRSGGLLLGAAAAFMWRPWSTRSHARWRPRTLDLSVGLAVGVLVASFIGAHLTSGYMYPGVMALTSIASLVAVAGVVHPSAIGARWLFGHDVLTAVGRRSYGLYLWHWPVFVVFGATQGSWGSFVFASLVAAGVSEMSYRWIETPVRKGVLSSWWQTIERQRRQLIAATVGVGLFVLGAYYVTVDNYDVAVGGEAVTFSLDAETVDGGVPATTSPPATQSTVASSDDASQLGGEEPVVVGSTTTSTSTTLPVLPRSVVILGDSTAHSLAINLPDGIEETFTISDGSLDGCSVWDEGRVVSERSFSNNFAYCDGWVDKWSNAVDGAELALVVIGAWDVFDLALDVDGVETVIPFASAEWDSMFVEHLTTGINALTYQGAQVALLEVACMRPQDVDGAGVPALPERGLDDRVAHVNELLGSLVDGENVWFVNGPTQWCDDETISSSLSYRWDGVHVYTPGANLIYETIARGLLSIPVVQA
jgi:peptidoglycan/LPS O-acetylase OafA/YrhL